MKALSKFLLLFPMFLPAVALAQDAASSGIDSIEQGAAYLPALYEAIRSGNWLVGGAIITMILCFLIKKYVLPKVGLGSGIMPIVSILVGLLAGVGASVYGGADLQAAAMASMSGPLASSLWDAIVKYFFKK